MAGRGGYGDANQNVDYVFQVVLMGNSAVGKSQIFTHFARNEFNLDTVDQEWFSNDDPDGPDNSDDAKTTPTI
ncbi:hypothetical protein Fmac_018714 [Flemingia macrophylla]|uniref:Uncharacterized protein n=1 Tax=Flemingia macrophylla TaxID=520843 RepID=A0ABD1M5S1_9FABA